MPTTFTPPTQADAQAAMDTLGPALLEDVAAPAVDHLNGRRQHHGEQPMEGREIGQLLGAVALAVRAYQQHAAPVAARWNKVVTRDESGTAWVLCTTDPGQSVALRLDEEMAEALAGGLLDGEDGEEVTSPALAERDRRIAELEEQLAAATNPGRAARQLADDAHP